MSGLTPEIADEICTDLSQGIPLAETCRRLGIGRTTVYDWRREDEAFAERIARAREVGFDAIADDCLAIADDKSRDVKLVGREGEEYEVCNTEFVQRAKLRIETRLKLLAKWDPKRYGDRQEVEHTGGVQLVMQSLDDQL